MFDISNEKFRWFWIFWFSALFFYNVAAIPNDPLYHMGFALFDVFFIFFYLMFPSYKD